MIQLRPYQEQAIAAIRGHFAKGRRKVLLCKPTGSGKTVTFSALVMATLQKDLFAKVLILTDRVELLTQAGGTLEKFGIRFEPITADNRKINPNARCYIGMVETFYKRAQKYPWLLDVRLVIIDEAHKGNFKKLFTTFKPETFIIGATATPLSAKKSDPLSNYYDALVNPVQITDLIEEGYLCPAVTYSAKVDRSRLQKDWSGEYSDASQMDTFAKREVYAGLVNKYRQFCLSAGKPRKTIVFNVNVAHSLEVCAEFNRAGFPCRHVDGMTDPAERERIISGYKSGEYPIICNVGILNAGFDDPATEVVIFNRATTSIPFWLQACGRGSRIYPGKENFIILDMGENYKELNLWESPRDWDTAWKQERKGSDKAGVAPVKDCPECEALVPLMAKTCAHCGYVFPAKEKEPAKDVEFEKINTPNAEALKWLDKRIWPGLTVPQLEVVRQYKDWKKGWLINVLRDRATSEDGFRRELAEARRIWGYKPGWERYQQFRPLAI